MGNDEQWFETVEIGGKRIPHVSKFLRSDFTVSIEFVEARWSVWTSKQKLEFAGALAAKGEPKVEDEKLVDFLIENGNCQIWSTIALLVAKRRDHRRALMFLEKCVKEGQKPLANYYQALEMLGAPECVPYLKEAMSKHKVETEQHPALESWGDRFVYLDYLSCSATLFKFTDEEEYRSNIRRMLGHPDETVRKMARMIASTREITLDQD